MKNNRREFIKTAVAASSVIALSPVLSTFADRKAPGKSLKMLVLGGSGFIGPEKGFTMGQMLNQTKAAIDASTRLTWVPAAFLAEHELAPGSVMPWVSPEGEIRGLARLSAKRAFKNGLTFRPFAETVTDTLEWWNSLPEDRRAEMHGGLRGGGLEFGPASMEQQMAREAEILKAWKATQAG